MAQLTILSQHISYVIQTVFSCVLAVHRMKNAMLTLIHTGGPNQSSPVPQGLIQARFCVLPGRNPREVGQQVESGLPVGWKTWIESGLRGPELLFSSLLEPALPLWVGTLSEFGSV